MSQPLIDLRRQVWYTGIIASKRDDFLLTCNLDTLCRTAYTVRGDKITKFATKFAATFVPYEENSPIVMMPVIYEASSEHRKEIALATSSGKPRFFIGIEEGMLKRMRNIQKLNKDTFRIRKGRRSNA